MATGQTLKWWHFMMMRTQATVRRAICSLDWFQATLAMMLSRVRGMAIVTSMGGWVLRRAATRTICCRPLDKTMTGSTSRSVLTTHLCSTWEVSLQTQSGFSRLAAQHGLPTSKALWLRISHQQKFTGTPGGLTTSTSPLLILLLLWLKSPRAISTSSWSKFWTQRSVSSTTLTLNHTSCSATSMQFSKTSTSN